MHSSLIPPGMPRPNTLPPISAKQQQDQVSEGIEQFELPKSLVTKIAKSAVPPEVKLQKDVVLSLVKSSTVFINFLAATAHDIALSKQHKSISASDVLKALEAVEFGDLVDPLQRQLKKYRESAKVEKKRAAKGKTSTTASAPAAAAGGPLSISITLPPKSKDKGKAKEVSISAPGPASDAMDVDDEGVDRKEDEIIEEDEDEAEMEEEAEDVMDEDDEEEDELVDTVVLEEEELRKDAKGLEEVGMKAREDGN